MKKRIIQAILVLVILSAAVLTWLFLIQPNAHPELTQEQFEEHFKGMDIPTFTEAPITASHQYTTGYPFVGSTLIDIDADGVDEVFIGGGAQQADQLLAFRDGGFLNILPEPEDLSEKKATLGAISIDADYDGDSDIMIAREDDLHLMMNEEGGFQNARLGLELPPNAIPFSIAAGDVNKDGLIDLYVSTFIQEDLFTSATFNDPNHRTQNIFLLGDEEQGMVDVTPTSGIDFSQNTFLSAFVDLDNDGWQDLVIAPNTDQVQVYKNLEGKQFQAQEPLTGFGFWMGLTVADIDQDGDQDLMLTNSGNTLPGFVSKGDLNANQFQDVEWALLRNEGNFTFTRENLNDYEFAWGAAFADLNMDGTDELIVSENYIKWPAHKLSLLPGRILMEKANQTWQPITELTQAINPAFGMTPLVSDFDRNGYLDIVYVNLDGPAKAYLNDGGENHFLKVIMPDTVESLGASVTVVTNEDQLWTKQFIAGQGLLSDQSNTLHFGLGATNSIDQLVIDWPNGEQDIQNDISVDTRIFIEAP